ncbi:MAG: LysR family transcriptional regulator [Clostridiales bacterium]|nr:LysR family transcriptional regulator [Clostridiales bacterium]
MQIQQLRYFLEIARLGNITAAAKSLYISQPSLSQQIIKLEEELGIQLLVRHSKSVSLTNAGEQFAQHAQRIIGGVDQLSDLMQKHSLLQAGTLKIGMLWVGGYLHLPELLASYHRLYPNIKYSLTVDGSANLLKLLSNCMIHGAFVIGEENRLAKDEELYYRKLQDDYYVAVVSTQNPLSRKEVLQTEDLQNENIIMPAKASAFRREVEGIFARHFLTPNILCESSQSDVVIQLASQNLGIGFSSRSIALALKTDAYAIVPLKEVIYRPIYYVTLKELVEYPSVRAFTRYVSRYRFE